MCVLVTYCMLASLWMKIVFFLNFLLFSKVSAYISFIEPKYQHVGEENRLGSTWPKPQMQESFRDTLVLDSNNFRMQSNANGCDVIREAVKRYRKLIFSYRHRKNLYITTRKILKVVNIVVVNFSNDKCGYPKDRDDESYVLEITLSGRAQLTSSTIWGVLRGLETFSQLIYADSEMLLVNATYIMDWPRFTYRGIMLDTARHFIPVVVIKQNLDAMAYNKMNVFHWHIVDDQSFPFESKVFPELSEKGAYSSTQIYRQSEVREIIAYARLRGIRVIPEFDTPGHTQSFGKAFPELLSSCYGEGVYRPNTPLEGIHASRENLDPTKNSTFTFLEKLFGEVRSVFPDEYIHLGMDEVFYECWRSSPEIERFMVRKGLVDVSDVEQYYAQRTVDIAAAVGYKYMAWQDPTDNGVKMARGTVIEIWKEDDWMYKMREVVKLGYRVVLSACWYLNYISYGEDWKKYYLCDPHLPLRGRKRKQQVIGGEACMWSEYVDETNLLARLWPRASAVAERLWSDSKTDDPEEAIFRLDEHRCRMLRRGIPAQPILSGYCPLQGFFEEEEGDEGVTSHFLSSNWFLLVMLVLFVAALLRRTNVIFRKLIMRIVPKFILKTNAVNYLRL